MNNLRIVNQFIIFISYVLVQVLFAKNLELFGLAFCFIYVNFILLFPLGLSNQLLLLLAFLMGILIDVFYDTLGMHAAATVLIAFLRPRIIQLISTRQEVEGLTMQDLGLRWFLTYSISLIFVHHLYIFMLQQFNFTMLLRTLLKVVASSAYTLAIIIIIQYLSYSFAKEYARK